VVIAIEKAFEDYKDSVL